MVNTDRLIEILQNAESHVAGPDRDAFLTSACAGDLELKKQVISLLLSHESAGDFLVRTVLSPCGLITDEPGTLIARYKLLEKLGEGGCGVVYVAEQSEPVRRRVALKVIKLGMDTKQVIARFEAERQALAMMDHPNIARVLDAGSTEAGRPYFVMELVRGVRITQFCNENQLCNRERLELFIKVCQAIQHAHQKGIIHRDIKPSNILVTLHDSVPVPKVIDFGIAKAIQGKLTDAAVYTQLLQFVGTPAYMSPEQAEMSGLDIDTRSDIYSLGALLYELLTGQTPFDGDKLISSGLDEMRKTIREKEPVRPSTRLTQMARGGDASRLTSSSAIRLPQSTIHSDLDWIVMKCLEKDRTRRYETANSLAADLQRHLNDEPIEARPASAAYKLQKSWRRNRLVFTSAGAVAMALLLGTGVSTWQAFKASRAQKSAEHQTYIANMFSAGQAWQENNYQMVRQLLASTRASANRGFEWYYWQQETHLNLRTLYGHTNIVKSIAFFPDGHRIVTGSMDKSARVWDITTGEECLKMSGHTLSVNSVAVSQDGKQIATASSDQTVMIWDSNSGQPLLKLEGTFGPLNAVAFSPDGQRIITGGSDGVGRICELSTKKVITFQGHSEPITSVAFSPDGQKVVTASRDGTAQVWRSADGAKLFPLTGHKREIRAVAFSSDGRQIVTGSLDLFVRFWDAQTGKDFLRPLEIPETVAALALSRDGRRMVTGSLGSIARVWNATNRLETELLILGHIRGIQAVAISPDGTRVVTGGFDQSVKVWDADLRRKRLRVEGDPTNAVLAVAISPNGQQIATGSGTFNNSGSAPGNGAQALQVWDSHTQKRLLTLSGHTSGVSSVAFSPNGDQIVSGSGDHTAKLWEAATGRPLHTFAGHTGAVTSVAFFPNGERIVTGSLDQTARVWNSATARTLFSLPGHTDTISSVAVSPDGKWIATGSFDSTTKLWEGANGRLVRTIRIPDSRIYSITFSPDSRRIAIGGWEPTTIWELDEINREPITLYGHSNVSSLAFSPDGSRIVTGGLGMITKLWETASGRELLTLRRHRQAVYSVAISTDGRTIITGSGDRTAAIWDAATTNQVAAWEAEERRARDSRWSR